MKTAANFNKNVHQIMLLINKFHLNRNSFLYFYLFTDMDEYGTLIRKHASPAPCKTCVRIECPDMTDQ